MHIKNDNWGSSWANLSEELVSDPTVSTKSLIDRILKCNAPYESDIRSGHPLKLFLINFKVQMYLKNGYSEFYRFFLNYKVPEFNGKGQCCLEQMLDEFEHLTRKLIFHNICLAYDYAIHQQLASRILTMEDKKVLFLQRFYKGEIAQQEFNDVFGHYGLNMYELSARRFAEYAPDELRAIAELTADLKIKKNMELEDHFSADPRDVRPALVALRELAKYKIFFLVRDIRYELLKIAQRHNIPDVFGLSFDAIIQITR